MTAEAPAELDRTRGLGRRPLPHGHLARPADHRRGRPRAVRAGDHGGDPRRRPPAGADRACSCSSTSAPSRRAGSSSAARSTSRSTTRSASCTAGWSARCSTPSPAARCTRRCPPGVGYTSIELKVNYLRAVHATSGPLTAIGRVVKPGRRVAFAEGEVLDAQGRTVATASSSLLVFPLPRLSRPPPSGGVPAQAGPADSADHPRVTSGIGRTGRAPVPPAVAPRPGGGHQRAHRRPARPRRRPRPRRSSATSRTCPTSTSPGGHGAGLRRDRHVRAARPGPPGDPEHHAERDPAGPRPALRRPDGDARRTAHRLGRRHDRATAGHRR